LAWFTAVETAVDFICGPPALTVDAAIDEWNEVVSDEPQCVVDGSDNRRLLPRPSSVAPVASKSTKYVKQESDDR